MTAPDRATLIAAFRRMLDIAEDTPDLPLPFMSAASGIRWTLYYPDRATVAAIERAVPCEFTGTISADETMYHLRGELDGVPVTISVTAETVAERRVTGTRVVEDVEWVRLLPAPEGNPA